MLELGEGVNAKAEKNIKKVSKKTAAAKETPVAAQVAAEDTVERAVAETMAETSVEDAAQEGVNGSKSDTIEFVRCLVNPAVIETNMRDGKPAKEPVIVGYQVKVLEDMEIPDVAPDADLATNMMSFKREEAGKKRMVKAGEIVNLTKFETAVIISGETFNGKFTGGNIPVSASYGSTKTKNAAGQVIDKSSVNKMPTVSLKGMSKAAHVRTNAPVEVLTVKKVTTPGANGKPPVVTKELEINPGFEKWAPLAVKKSPAARGTGAGRAAGGSKAESRNPKAVAFLAAVAKAAYTETAEKSAANAAKQA